MQGLISVDRNSKATQPLTIPRPIQVVCKGSSPRNRQVWSRWQPVGTCYVPLATGTDGAGSPEGLLTATRLQLLRIYVVAF